MAIAFTDHQLDKLGDVFINIGTLFFGAAIVPVLIPSLDKPLLWSVILGLGLSFGCWLLALIVVRRMSR